MIRERYDMSGWVSHGARMLGNRGHFRMPELSILYNLITRGLFCNLREGRVFYVPCCVYGRNNNTRSDRIKTGETAAASESTQPGGRRNTAIATAARPATASQKPRQAQGISPIMKLSRG